MQRKSSVVQVMLPLADRPDEGQLQVSVEFTALTPLKQRRGRYEDVPGFLTDQVCTY